MWWHYRFMREENDAYIYAYSRESKACDGTIIYHKNTKDIEIVKRCKVDEGANYYADQQAVANFLIVVKENFPKERQVACG